MTGYGECVAGDNPFYNHETIDTAWLMTTKYIVPLLEAKRITSAAQVRDALAPIRENRMAKAGVEAAIWDLEAKQAEQPLWRYIGGTRPEIACGVSIGLQDSTAALLDKVSDALECGYQRIRSKSNRGRMRSWSKRCAAGFRTSRFQSTQTPRIARHGQPSLRATRRVRAPDDRAAAGPRRPRRSCQVTARVRTSICLDESILSLAHAQHAHELGACRIINIKLGRVGGYSEAKDIQAFAQAHGMPVWCGGMLEAGIGRAHNIALDAVRLHAARRSPRRQVLARGHRRAAGDGESCGHDRRANGYGIGFEVNEARVEALTVRRETVRLGSLQIAF